jgi:hypothetical protein
MPSIMTKYGRMNTQSQSIYLDSHSTGVLKEGFTSLWLPKLEQEKGAWRNGLLPSVIPVKV